MGDQDSKPKPDSIPEWQHTQTDADADTDAANVPPVDLEVARRFLDDEQVKTASRQKKTDFLKSKGIPDAQIEALLAEVEEDTKAEMQVRTGLFDAPTIQQSTNKNYNSPKVIPKQQCPPRKTKKTPSSQQ